MHVSRICPDTTQNFKKTQKRITAQTKPYEYIWLYHLVHMLQFSDKDFKMKLPVFKIFLGNDKLILFTKFLQQVNNGCILHDTFKIKTSKIF